MGASKSYRGGPGWQSKNTPGPSENNGAGKVSSGSKSSAEGTHMSGGQSLRAGAKAQGNKSSSGRMGKQTSIYGKS